MNELLGPSKADFITVLESGMVPFRPLILKDLFARTKAAFYPMGYWYVPYLYSVYLEASSELSQVVPTAFLAKMFAHVCTRSAF